MHFAGAMLHEGHTQSLFLLFGCAYGLAALCWLAVDVTRPLRVKDEGGRWRDDS